MQIKEPTAQNLEKPPFLRGLFWKITFSIVAIVLSVWFVTLLLVGLDNYSQLRADLTEPGKFTEAQQAAAEAAELLEVAPRSPVALRLWLQNYREKIISRNRATAPDLYYYYEPSGETGDKSIYLCLTDDSGNLIAASRELREGELPPFTAEETVLFERAAAKDKVTAEDFTVQAADGTVSRAIPLRGSEDHSLIGVWLWREKPLLSWTGILQKLVFDFLKETREGLWYLIVFAVIFSFPLTHYLSQRLKHIALAAHNWSQGDFAARTNDPAVDELGILARRLNEMASELGSIFVLRQELAALEERNRIARDLHDSVKQQVFGLAMQIGAADKLFEKDPESSKLRLIEAKKLVRQVQRELVNLIKEIRPVIVEGTTFKERLTEYVLDWSRHHAVEVKIEADHFPVLPDSVAKTLFRIVQETLANIARHSRASETRVILSVDAINNLKISVIDNGLGFELSQVKHGQGLQNIRDRAATLPAGQCFIESQVGGGSAVVVKCRLAKN